MDYDLLTVGELARRWRVSNRTLERWRATGGGPAWLHLGGRVFYRTIDIDAHEAASRCGGAG